MAPSDRAGASYGTLETVNGAIAVSGVSAGRWKRSTAASAWARTPYRLGRNRQRRHRHRQNATVKGNVESVSGRADVGAGAHVGGDIEPSTASSPEAARVDGDVEGVNGGITLHGSQWEATSKACPATS